MGEPLPGKGPTVEEVVKQLTTLVSSGPVWPYALVLLNGDICHVPLPREGHLSVPTEGGTSSATCRRVSQLEVHQLLSLGLQVIYPVGLNGHEIPKIHNIKEAKATFTHSIQEAKTLCSTAIRDMETQGASQT